MSLSSRFRTWWRAVTRRAEVDAQVDEELQFHIESYAEDLMHVGISRDEAMRRAKAELGSLAARKESCRQAWGTRWFDELRADLRYAVRMLAKSPGFAAIAIGSLALGIGANTAIFSIAKHVLLDRLNVPHAEQLRLLMWTSKRESAVHSVWGDWNKGYDGVYSTSFSYPIYEVLRKENRGLEDLFAFKGAGRMDVTINGQAEVIQAELVSGNYYQQMQIQPRLGRAITKQDDRPGAAPVAVISDEYWARRFNRSDSVIGRTILLNLTPTTIVGVNPPGFTGAKSVEASPEIFAPLAMESLVSRVWDGSLLENPNRWWLQIMARPKPGMSETAAQAQLTATLQQAVVALMKPKSGDALPRLLVMDGSRGLNEAGKQLAQPLFVLLALAGMVLMLACANLANLLLARSTARQREMSVRLALGAGRGRILRQVLTESILLAVCGGSLGLLMGYLGRNALLYLTATSSSDAAPMQGTFSWGVFAFNAGLSLATGILFGLAPALKATRTEVQSSLKESAQTTTRRRHGYAGKAIVAFQIAVSMLLVAGAGVFLRTLINLHNVDPGFDTRDLVLFEVEPPKSRYPIDKQPELFGRIEERLASVPGVDAVSAESIAFLANSRSMDDFVPPGTKPGEAHGELDNYVGDQFFATLHIPILAGRSFTAEDNANATRVAVINQALAKKYWPGQDAIGKTFTTSDMKDQKLPYTIVGICANTHYDNLRNDPPPIYFLSYRQAPDVSWGMTFAVRTRTPRATITPSLRAAVSSVDRDLPLIEVRTQQEQIDEITTSERVFANLTAGFGVLALALACIGIYGIMAYTVSRRTNEIGIRMALGAGREHVLRMVLSEATWMAAIGIAAGLGSALALARLVASQLYGLKASDPGTLLISAALLILVALGASWIPARRAAGVDPMRALRHE
ncbi:MAG TPA: ABC transporter permease [Silvibacterium sp.]|nr:ABC transporter permease [Silvibacterium sp.]